MMKNQIGRITFIFPCKYISRYPAQASRRIFRPSLFYLRLPRATVPLEQLHDHHPYGFGTCSIFVPIGRKESTGKPEKTAISKKEPQALCLWGEKDLRRRRLFCRHSAEFFRLLRSRSSCSQHRRRFPPTPSPDFAADYGKSRPSSSPH